MLVIVSVNGSFFAYCIYALRSYLRLTLGMIFRKPKKKKSKGKTDGLELAEIAHVNPTYDKSSINPKPSVDTTIAIQLRRSSVKDTLHAFRTTAETAEQKAIRRSIAREKRSERDLLVRRHSKMFHDAAVKDQKMDEDVQGALEKSYPWWT